MDLTSRSHRLHRLAILVTALMPAPMLLLVLLPEYRRPSLVAWAACYAVFLGALAYGRGHVRRAAPVGLIQMGAGLAAAWVLPTTAEGAMLVTAAAQLSITWRTSHVVAIAIVASSLFGVAMARQAPLQLAVDVGVAWCVFQIFAVLMTGVARSEAEGRLVLRERNVELVAARQLLAEQARAAERLRVSRDLHDHLGHHLTALNLNLEAAVHLSRDGASAHVERAQRVARTLLADVRETVSGIRAGAEDPMSTIRALAQSVDDPIVHVEGPVSLSGQWPAQAMLRMAQEVITNAIRHADARNVWIAIHESTMAVTFEARDDGRGTDHVCEGNGLVGMRERISEIGGSLEVVSPVGGGFLVRASIPAQGGSS